MQNGYQLICIYFLFLTYVVSISQQKVEYKSAKSVAIDIERVKDTSRIRMIAMSTYVQEI